MKKTVRTIYGALLDSANRFKDDLKIFPKSTLNEKYNVFPDQKPNPGELPHTQCFAIGLKGATVTVSDNMFITTYREYNPSWASLLGPIPFIVRRQNDDLTEGQKALYRMRTTQSYNGVPYICYYLKKLDLDLGTPDVEKRVMSNGSSVNTPWSPSDSHLNPQPMETAGNPVTVSEDTFLTAFKKIKVELTPFDIQEIMNACNIIYGNPDVANINEIALVSGVDRNVQTSGGSGPVTVRELIYAQVTDFVKTTIACPNEAMGRIIYLDAGSNEPVYIAS